MKFARYLGPNALMFGEGFSEGDLMDVWDDAVLNGRPVTDWSGLKALTLVEIDEPTAAELVNLLPDEDTGKPRASLNKTALQAVAIVPAAIDDPDKHAVVSPIAAAPKLDAITTLKKGIAPKVL